MWDHDTTQGAAFEGSPLASILPASARGSLASHPLAVLISKAHRQCVRASDALSPGISCDAVDLLVHDASR